MKKIIVLSLLLAAATLPTAHAQTTPLQTFINWRASTYIPPAYQGKAIPTSDSALKASVDIFNDGKHLDLSPYKVYWYVNDQFYRGAFGLTQITFNAPHFIGTTSIKLRVSVPDYAGAPSRTITIPVMPPKIVIQSSAPSLAAADAPFTLRAYPFFFNIENPADLLFSWNTRNLNLSAQDSLAISQDMAQGGPIKLDVQVNNPLHVVERVAKTLTLFSR